MKDFFAESPFLRLLMAFIVGILIHHYWSVSYSLSLSIFLLILVLNLVFFSIKNHVFQFANKNYAGALLFLLVVSTAIYVSSLRDQRNSRTHFTHYLNADNYYSILLDNDPIKTPAGFRCKGKVIAIQHDHYAFRTIGGIALFIKDTASRCCYGDVLICRGIPQPIRGPENPYEFDNRSFLCNKNIYGQLFVKASDYQIHLHHQNPVWITAIHDLRDYLSHCFDQSIDDTTAAAVAKALILGDDDDIDTHLMKAYSSCGVIHVLSVSGLHVGIFFILINYLFGLIKKETKFIKIGKTILIILLVWWYTALSGFSASVLRSAVMLSFVVIGNSLQRRINIYNSLSASCFFLLCYNSRFLFDVGFQLSYISVYGILYIQPKIYGAWAIKNYLGDKIWQMTSVSLAAQLVTFPLSVYYFYQFPTLFLFANLLIIPLITLALLAGFGFLVICFFNVPKIGWYAAKPLAYLLIVINKIVLFMDSIAYNSIKNIFLSPIETIGLYSVFIVFFCWVEWRKVRLFQLTVGLALVLMVYMAYQKTALYRTKTLIVYSLSNLPRVEYITHGTSETFTNSSLQPDDKNYGFHIHPFRVHQYIKKSHETILQKSNYIIEINGFSILYLSRKGTIIGPLLSKQSYDLIIIENNAVKDINSLSSLTSSRPLVLGNTNTSGYLKKVEAQPIRMYNQKKEQALVLSLK